MNKKIRIAAEISVVIFCMLLGCERKENQQTELLLPVKEETTADETANTVESGEEPVESSPGEDTGKSTCVVHICGAVNRPGVYILDEGSRIYQAIEQAGGFCEESDEDYLNQAQLLTDGMKLYVPTKEEVAKALEAGSLQSMNDSAFLQEENSLVNINTAGEDLLCTLPGVGSSKAKSIIAYREKNGAFQKTEDIMKVEGIKDGLFQKIKDSITV